MNDTAGPALTAKGVAQIKALGLLEASVAILDDDGFRRSTRDVIAEWLTNRAAELLGVAVTEKDGEL